MLLGSEKVSNFTPLRNSSPFFPELRPLPNISPSKNSYKRVLPQVECGLFGITEDFFEKFQSLDERFIKHRDSTYFFEASGQSMEPTINPGDILIVDRSLEYWEGKICILQHEGALICKRVFLKEDHVYLHSDNSNFEPIKVYEESSSLVWGVVIAKVSEFL